MRRQNNGYFKLFAKNLFSMLFEIRKLFPRLLITHSLDRHTCGIYTRSTLVEGLSVLGDTHLQVIRLRRVLTDFPKSFLTCAFLNAFLS